MDTAEIHQLLPNFLLTEQDSKAQNIGVCLKRLRDRGRKADYGDVLSKPDRMAELSIDDAKIVMAGISSL
jgi:hypothetical protein